MKLILKLKGFYDNAYEGNTNTLNFTLDSEIVSDFEFGEDCFKGVSSSSSIKMSQALKTELESGTEPRIVNNKIDDMNVVTL